MEGELKFNLLGKIIYIKENFPIDLQLFQKFYDANRDEYIVDIPSVIFERILQYYSTQNLTIPTNIQLEYFKEILEKFHIDTSALDRDERYERLIPRRKRFQIIHILFEYANSCQLAQILHYMCSMIALMSCALSSLSLIFVDLSKENRTEGELMTRSSKIFILDIFCLIWAIGETILRVLTTPSLYRYLTTLGLFDLIGVLCHLIYICIISTRTDFISSFMVINSTRTTTLNRRIVYRRVMIIGLLRKLRLVRYIRPLKFFLLSLLQCKREIIRLVVLISFLLAFLAPLIYIIESSHLSQCSSSSSTVHCIRTISDACYYLILIITTVGFGDIDPISSWTHLISMFTSLLSLMMISILLSAIYSQYVAMREVYQIQVTNPENIRYLIDDHQTTIQREDVTVEVNERLKYFNICRR